MGARPRSAIIGGGEYYFGVAVDVDVPVPIVPVVDPPIAPPGVIVPVELPVDIDPSVLVPGIDVDIDPLVLVPVVLDIEPVLLRLDLLFIPVLALPLVPVDIVDPVPIDPIDPPALEPVPPVVCAIVMAGTIMAAAAIVSAIRISSLL